MSAEHNDAMAKREEEVSFLFFVLGGVAGLISLEGTLPFGKGFETYALALSLAHHAIFGNPYPALQTGPSAISPPLFPMFLAFLMKVLRAPSFVLLAAALANIFANSVTAALLPRMSSLFFDEIEPGIMASTFWLLSAQLIPCWDADYTLAALLCFCLLTAATVKREQIFRFAVVAGLLAGVLLLLNPMSSLIFVPWLACLVFSRRASIGHTAAYVSIVLTVALFMAFPWMLRNKQEIGAFTVRTGLGLNLYVSNNDCSGTNLVDDLKTGCALKYQPNFNVGEAATVRDLGEVQYDNVRLAMAMHWIGTHRSQFLHLTLSRFVAFWFPATAEHPFQVTVIRAVTLLSFPGIILMAYRRVQLTIFSLVAISIYPLLYYVVFSEVRFRYPLLWLSMLPAGYFLVTAYQVVQTRLPWRPTWLRAASENPAIP